MNNGRRFLVTLGEKTYDFELSICEDIGLGEEDAHEAKRFREGQVSFRRFMKFPAVVHDKNLVIKWNGRYITRQENSPLTAALVTWREAALAKPANASALEEEEPLSSSDEREPDEKVTPKKSSSSWVRWWRSSRKESEEASPSSRNEIQRRPSLVASASAPPVADNERATTPVPSEPLTQNRINLETLSQSGKRFAKTLRLTSDQLASPCSSFCRLFIVLTSTTEAAKSQSWP